MSSLIPRGALLALGAAAFGLPAATAQAAAPANTYEQISRASGAAGNTKLDVLTTPQPSFVSDVGVTAAYTESPSAFNLQFGPQSATLRNLVTNQTRNLGNAVGELRATDRFEQVGLFRRQEIVSPQVRKIVWAVGRIDGTNLRDLDIGSSPESVELSGNGKFVVTSDQQGLRRINVATGVSTQIAPLGIIGPDSVSDDGQTIAAIDFDQYAQRIDAVIWKNGQRQLLVEGYRYGGDGTEPKISADGSTAITVTSAYEWPERSTVTAHRLAAGTTATTATTEIPFEETWSVKPLWVSPTGDRIAFALGWQDAGLGAAKPAQVWKVGAGWSTFGGQFATSLRSDDGYLNPASAISRNGLFAGVAYNDQVAVVSLTGMPLLGNLLGREGLSASSYIDSPGLDYCGFGWSSTFIAAFTRPAAWAPAPRKAKITVSNGSTVLADQQWTKPAGGPGGQSGDYDGLSVTFPLQTAHTRNVALSVVDGHGRTVSEQLSANVTCGQLPTQG